MKSEHCDVDVVIDTNVLSHADNPGCAFQLSAQNVVRWIRESEVLWILDDSGKTQPDPRTSHLFAEYRQTLPPMGASLQLFTSCLAGGRVRFARRPHQEVRNTIRKLVPKNKKDQIVLGAAAGSVDKVLISNDESDFTDEVRNVSPQHLGVQILHSEEFSFIASTESL